MADQQGITPGSLMFAFIAGVAVGAAGALLLAPATGREAREYLNQRAREGRTRASDAARQGRDRLNRQRETMEGAFGRKGAESDPGGPEEQGA